MPDAPQDRLPVADQPPRTPKVPAVRAPVGACDAHVHILSGPEFPLYPDRLEDPADIGRYEDWLALFHQHLDTLGCTRTVLVQSMMYGTENAITVETIRRLGRMARGIALVGPDVSDGSLDRLRAEGIVGVRVHLAHRGVLSWEDAVRLAPRLADRGMHVQVMVHVADDMARLAADLPDLPVDVVIDHCGLPDGEAGAGAPGLDALRRALGEGRAWVKLSGLYRFTDAPYRAADAIVRAFVDANPERCLWGSDWPHIMLGGRPMPDAGVLLDTFMRQVPDEARRHAILVDNPAALYGFI